MPFQFPSFLLALVALVAGALVSLQAGANAELGRALGHPLWATFVSLLVSLIVAIPVLLLAHAPAPTIPHFGEVPFWAWLGGIAGTIFVTSALLLVPRIGATSFIVAVIAGQICVSLLMDKFGLLNLPVKEISFGRLVGVCLVISGMLTVQWFSPTAEKSEGVDLQSPRAEEPIS